MHYFSGMASIACRNFTCATHNFSQMNLSFTSDPFCASSRHWYNSVKVSLISSRHSATSEINIAMKLLHANLYTAPPPHPALEKHPAHIQHIDTLDALTATLAPPRTEKIAAVRLDEPRARARVAHGRVPIRDLVPGAGSAHAAKGPRALRDAKVDGARKVPVRGRRRPAQAGAWLASFFCVGVFS